MTGVDGVSRQGSSGACGPVWTRVDPCARSIGELRPCHGLFYICGALESGLAGHKRALTDGLSLEGHFGHGVYSPLLRPPGRQEHMTDC